MPLIGGSLPIGATFAPTGGTARTLLDLGGDFTRRKLLIDDGAEFNLSRVINLSKVTPQANSGYPGGYTPVKRRVALVHPKVLADGKVFNNQRIEEIIVHPETTDAEIIALLSDGSNIDNDTDFQGFWLDGTLS